MNKHFPCKIKCDVSRQIKSPQKAGFALIATIAVMALMAVTALAMLSLSTVEVRSSNHGDAMSEARANARMALMIAIGELQKAAGPDTRVTAEGDIDDSPGQGKNHWMGVWSSADETTGTTPKKAGEFIGWMVSKPSSTTADYTNINGQNLIDSSLSNGLPNYVTLVGDGSADISTNPEDEVIVPKVEIVDTTNDISTGHYAYWIGDEGVKARIDLQTSDDRDDRLATMGTQRSAFEVMTEIKDSKQNLEVDDPKIVKLISSQSVAHVSSQEVGKSHFHDISSHSLGIATTTRDPSSQYGTGKTAVVDNGGLKIDLSLLFEKSDSDFEDLEPDNYTAYNYENAPFGSAGTRDVGLIFTVDNVSNGNSTEGLIYGPTMDMLRTYYRLYKDVENKDSSPTLSSAFPFYPNASEYNNDLADTGYMNADRIGYRNQDTNTHKISKKSNTSYEVTRNTKPNVSPYINRVLYYFSVITEPTSTPPDQAGAWSRISKVVVTPIVILHNPYDVSIDCPDMAYSPGFGSSRMYILLEDPNPNDLHTKFKVDGTLGKLVKKNKSLDLDNDKYVTNGNLGEATLKIPAIKYKPGEIKLFIPNGLKALQNEHELVELSSGANIDGGFYYELKPASRSYANLMATDLPGPGEAGYNEDKYGNWDENDAFNHSQYIRDDFALQLYGCYGGYLIQRLDMYNGSDRDRVYTSRGVWLEGRSTGSVVKSLADCCKNAPKRFAIDYETGEDEVGQPTNYYDFYTKPFEYEIPANYTASTTSSETAYGFPTYVLNNPLCVSDCGVDIRNSADVEIQASPGSSAYSPYKSSHADYCELDELPNRLMNILAPQGGTTTWGGGMNDEGQTTVTALSIPTAPLISIGSLQHANLYDQGNQPALVIGNSFPNLHIGSIANTFEEREYTDNKGYLHNYVPFDAAFHTNEAIWDYYFFSSISPKSTDSSYNSSSAKSDEDIELAISDWIDGNSPIANERITFISNGETSSDIKTALNDPDAYKYASAYMGIKGSFNINSTSVEAWKAILSGYRGQTISINPEGNINDLDVAETSLIPRNHLSLQEGIESPSPTDDEAWVAFSQLSDDKITELAEAIVSEIKDVMKENASRNKGSSSSSSVPILSLADFVNRMPDSSRPEYQTCGLLQRALRKAGTNDSLNRKSEGRTKSFTTESVTSNARKYVVKLPEEFPELDAASSSSFILQSDILQAIGSHISARSDTFKIRAYGDSVDRNGTIIAEAWCEAIIQRTPAPVVPLATTGLGKWTPDTSNATNYGRKMNVISFKWLSRNEI
ncbi:hypothetical protein [Persicirhabdus sediminis]|uniref:Uncharacterized protein n=1 Tax=Persicirhabdus sediminis TaxID=454144 RepID=A0A8J7MBY7_9BACT|nr:hypothetical protein [Persicirhabdus sediminis]MBK1789778.1 hypothetical protein [Persicirhabdus sediminis]